MLSLVISLIHTEDVLAGFSLKGSGVQGFSPSLIGGSSSGGVGIADVPGFRIRAIKINDRVGKNPEHDHVFIYTGINQVAMRHSSTVYNTGSEADYRNWTYILPANRGNGAHRYFYFATHGNLRTMYMSGFDTPKYQKLKNILGVKGDETKYQSWDTAIQNYAPDNLYNGDELGKFFGIEGSYYLVVEQIIGLYKPNDHHTWVTYQAYRNDARVRDKLHAKYAGAGDGVWRLLNDSANYINQGAKPPVGWNYTEHSQKNQGYAIYADFNAIGDGDFHSKLSLNVVIEYQGDPKNSSKGGKMLVRSSLIRDDSQKYDSSSKSFINVKTNTKSLLNATNIDFDYPYSYFSSFSEKLGIPNTVFLDDFLLNADATLAKHTIHLTPDLVDGAKYNVGSIVQPDRFENFFDRSDLFKSHKKSENVGDVLFKRFRNLGASSTGARSLVLASYSKTIRAVCSLVVMGRIEPVVDLAKQVTNEQTTALSEVASREFCSVTASDDKADGKAKLLAVVRDISRRGYRKSDGDALSNRMGKGFALLKGKKIGFTASYLVRTKKIVSDKLTATVRIDKHKNIKRLKVKKIDLQPYTNLDKIEVKTDKSARYIAVIPYNSANKTNFKKALSKLSVSDFVTSTQGLDNAVTSLGAIVKSTEPGNVMLGCDANNLEGYTVCEVIVTKDEPTGGNNPDPESGKVELPAYMLNRYFPNIINTSSGGKMQYQVGKDFTVKKELYKDQETCPRCGSTFFPITQPRRHQDWNIEWRDQSSSGYHIALDNKNRDRYFPSMPNSVWGNAKRSTLASWTSQNTEGWSDPSGKIIDYGFNLIRASVKDNKALSGIAYKTYDVVDKDNVLQFKPYFGVSPVSNPLRASSLRSSMALAGKVSDTITVASRYTRYHGSGFDEKLNHHFEPEIGHNVTHTSSGKNADGSTWTNSWTEYVVDKPEVNIDWYTFPTKTASGIRINGSSANSFTYTFESNVRKYQTATMGTGENEKISGGSTAVDINAFSPREGEVTDGNEYRFANVRNNGITHSFYPEVNMVYKIDGTQYDGSSPYRIASTMGEVLRKSKSSSLYLFKVNGVGQTTTGVTYSDSALGGTVSRGSKGVIIPAGADVHIKAEPKNITIDLYAYALDSINADTDSTFKPEKFTTHKYTDIVASGKNVDTEWNGKANRPALIKHFSDWADDILDIRNFSADFELHVRGIKKASNFSAVVGDIKRNKSISEDGVYQLQFKKGTLLANRDYILLIKQIASDYQCSESEADGVFKASGIYTSILNAIESSTSDINNSGKAQLGSADWTNDLGSDGNWYDEYVNTFVVRRFTNKGNKINSITATDKIDYGLAPDGSERRLQNANYNRVNRAFWKLSIFFNPARAKEVKDLLVDRGSFYDPSKRWSKFSEARDSFTVLMHGVRVQRADFGISADSTKEF